MTFEVRTIPAFEKEFKKLSKKHPSLKSDLYNLIERLEANPLSGFP
jgi:mRNA-degrading endonuclease RelE of RelBE toxin-antitoxin system